MSDKKITQLTEQTTTTNDDVFVVVDGTSGATKKVQASNILPAGSVGTADIADASVTNAKLSTTGGEIGAAGASWTPTWTNLSVGNGTVTARYIKIGKTITARLSLVFGSTTSVSGDITFTLPATAVSYAGTASVTQIGGANMYDASVPRVFHGVVNMASTTTATVRPLVADTTALYSLTASNTFPFSWATGDEIGLTFKIEAS